MALTRVVDRRTAGQFTAMFTDDAVTPPPVAIDDEIFTQQPKCFDRLLVGELADACNRHPVPPQHFAGRLATTDLG